MNRSLTFGQQYYGHGKIVLSGEYLVLDGAMALGLPTTVGQALTVKYRKNYNPHLYWKSFTHHQQLWFEAQFDFWHFTILQTNDEKIAKMLKSILTQARVQNSHFLRSDEHNDVYVEMRLEFPLLWGLGTSSTLIHNIAQWANIGSYELQVNTFQGSGLDVAVAQSNRPILYQIENQLPLWRPVNFNPSFIDQLFFVYLDKKQNSQSAVKEYKNLAAPSSSIIDAITQITKDIISCPTKEEFSKLIDNHEKILASHLNLEPIKKIYFSDYPMSIKSLGAWGGDFVLAVGLDSAQETRDYFLSKGFLTCIPYRELII